VSHLLEILGKGLDHEVEDLLRGYFCCSATESIEELERDIEVDAERPERRLALALAYRLAERAEDARTCLEAMRQDFADYMPAVIALAVVLYEGGDVEGALRELRFADQAQPGEAPILHCLGFCLERRGELEPAAACYRQALRADDAYTPSRYRLAAVALAIEDVEEAVEQYTALRRDDPQDGWVRTALGHLLYRAGRFSESCEEFEAAIVIEPENWALVDDEVESLAQEGRHAEAIERLRGLIEEQGPFADLHVRIADLYDQIGDEEAATKHYRVALEIQPNYLEATVKLGTHHLLFGRWEEAAETFYQAAELNDRVLMNYIGMGVAQHAAGREGDAMNSFDLATAVEPNSTLLLGEMARLQLRAALADSYARSFGAILDDPPPEIDLDNEVLARRQLQRHEEQIRRTPNRADLRYRYGVLLRSEGNLDAAREEFQRALELSPAYATARVKLGITEQELGRIEQAVKTFSQSLQIDQGQMDLHYKLGLMFVDRGEFEAAVRHMEEAAPAEDAGEVRAGVALSLQNMGLMDRAAATWRSLYHIHSAA
jgi:tetratricopeptide (TPR) repeat protein